MGLAFFTAIVLLLFGIVQLADKNKFGLVWIGFSIIFPLVVTVSLYPVFALASIDENISMLNQKIDKIILINKNHAQEKSQSAVTTDISKTFFDPTPTPPKRSGDENLFKYAEAIDYVNKRYGRLRFFLCMIFIDQNYFIDFLIEHRYIFVYARQSKYRI